MYIYGIKINVKYYYLAVGLVYYSIIPFNYCLINIKIVLNNISSIYYIIIVIVVFFINSKKFYNTFYITI